MTREEAIARIKDHIEIHRYHERDAVKIFEALDTAIKAMERPDPCEDAVSRAFMYELGATCVAKPDGNGNLIALGRIDMLPPVTPKPKTGKWIEHSFSEDGKTRLIECSECGAAYTVNCLCDYSIFVEERRYCNKCGAKMEEEQ